MCPTQYELQLLDQLGWVRQLARSLVRDPSQADDLVQEAWLAAASGGPGANDAMGLRRWLSAVVGNLARKQARGADRRARREAAVARPEAVDEDVVARGALHRELADAVLQLAEPQRSAILLCYLDGLSAIEIAERQGVSHDAARKRISRGLAELRARLDAARGGDRQAWIAALGSWLERAELLETKAAPTDPLASWNSTALWKLGLATAAVLLTALGWYAIDPFTAQQPQPEFTSASGGVDQPNALQAPARELPRAAMGSTQVAADFTLVDEHGAPRADFIAIFLDDGRLRISWAGRRRMRASCWNRKHLRRSAANSSRASYRFACRRWIHGRGPEPDLGLAECGPKAVRRVPSQVISSRVQAARFPTLCGASCRSLRIRPAVACATPHERT